jgi:hypothetical protein
VTLSKRAVLNYFRGTNKINSAFKKWKSNWKQHSSIYLSKIIDINYQEINTRW